MARTAIIVTFDRLPCAGLGCYGNEWIDTPGFDALAADGFVFDRAIAEEVRGDTDGVTFGPRLDSAWIAALRQSGVTATLLHEPHSELVVDPAAFDSVHDCGGEDGLDVAAADLPFARVVRRATTLLAEPTPGDRLLWLSSAGLPDICRPPEGALDLYIEEFAQHDIDWDALSPEAFGRHPAIRAAYVSILDHWLGQLRAVVQKLTEPVLLIVLGCEGRVWQPVPRRDPVPGGLEAQVVETPWLMTSNDGQILPGRSAALVQLSDLPLTVVEWWLPGFSNSQRSTLNSQLSLWPLIRGERTGHRDVAITRAANGAMALRTATESVVFADRSSVETSPVCCFLHPEDGWEVNDVAGSQSETIARIASLVP